MKRDEWTFSYTAAQLAIGATTKRQYHAERLAWWKGKKDEIMQKIKDEGLEIDESLAVSNSANYNRGATVQVRNDLMADLQECVQKVREHFNKFGEYDGWAQVLEAQGGGAYYALHHDDWLFFFSEATFKGHAA